MRIPIKPSGSIKVTFSQENDLISTVLGCAPSFATAQQMVTQAHSMGLASSSFVTQQNAQSIAALAGNIKGLKKILSLS